MNHILMRRLLDFDDTGATDEEPVKGVTVGDIRAWFDEMERMKAEINLLTGSLKS